MTTEITTPATPKMRALVNINPLLDPNYLKLQTEITNICEYIKTAVLITPEDVSHLTEDVNLAQQVAKKCEILRKGYKDPLTQYGKKIEADFKLLTDPIADARENAGANIKKYNEQQREIQRLIDAENLRVAQEAARLQQEIDDENARLIAEAEAAGKREIVEDTGEIIEHEPVELIEQEPEPVYISHAPVIHKAQTATGSATENMVAKFKLVDISKVPENLVLLDEKAVRAQLKAGVRSIEGLEIWEEPEVAFRSK